MTSARQFLLYHSAHDIVPCHHKTQKYTDLVYPTSLGENVGITSNGIRGYGALERTQRRCGFPFSINFWNYNFYNEIVARTDTVLRDANSCTRTIK